MAWKWILLLVVVLLATRPGVEGQEKDDDSSGSGDSSAVDPCTDLKCSSGEECVVRNGKGSCECLEECPGEWNDYPRSLCTTEGLTFRHECELWRAQCLCKKDNSKCPTVDGKKPSQFTIQYFDECRDVDSMCDWDRQKDSYSLRMSMWFRDLFTMKWTVPGSDIEDDSLLRPMTAQARDRASKLLNQNTGNVTYVPGGIISYWFCEIDRDNSNSIDRTEITRLTQILSPATECLNEFLKGCGGATISYDQWHSCLSVPSDERSACNSF